MDLKKITAEIIKIAQEAGDAFKKERNFEIKEKGTVANVVTSMDVKTQKFVLEQLNKVIPNASVYAEENNQQEMTDGYVWVVDPIDGTCNYTYDLKRSCISIALLYQKEVCIGVIYNPYLNECFHAIAGQGAYCNENKLHVSDNDIHNSLFFAGTTPYNKEYADATFERLKKMFLIGKDVRRSGSAALDLCDLAAGRCDGFYEYNLAPWDYAAGALIVKEAGGIVDTIEPYTWGYEGSITIIGGNPNNFDQLVEIVK